MAYTAITVGFALLYPLIIKTELDYFTVCCIILLYGVPGIVLFSLRGKYNAFLEVEGKKYVVTSLAMVTMVISNLLKLIFLMISDNLLLIQATYCVPSIVQVVFIIFYVRKHYQWIDWKAEPDHSALAQKNSVLIHQISSCLFSNTDTVIISFMCGMNYASVYAVFSLFFANFQQLITAFSNGVTFRFGQLYHSSREQFERAFEWYESLYYMFVFWVYTVITAFLMPIIRLYTSGIADASIYDSKKMLLLFAAWSILSCVEMPLIQLQSIAGKFDDTKGQAVREMVINILVSLILTWRIGIAGCLIVSGASHTISTSTAGGRGFTAIIVAWMSKFNPFAMILVSAFLVFMQQGSIQIASQFGLNENASDIITGILLFFLIGCEFFINYKLEWKKNHKEGK